MISPALNAEQDRQAGSNKEFIKINPIQESGHLNNLNSWGGLSDP